MVLWRAGDDDDKELDMLAKKRRNIAATLKLLGKLLKNHGIHRDAIVIYGLAS